MITQKQKKDFLRERLSTDARWACRALIVIYDRQTSEEKSSDRTIVNNEVGFSGVDAEILSSFARQYRDRGWLTEKQMALLFRKIPKYWGQIIGLIDPESLEGLIQARGGLCAA